MHPVGDSGDDGQYNSEANKDDNGSLKVAKEK
jgi:hypothetical protein